MNDKHFLDTNILVYCYTSTELEKREKAQRVAKLPNTIISTQVLAFVPAGFIRCRRLKSPVRRKPAGAATFLFSP